MLIKQQDFSVSSRTVSKEEKLYFILKPTFLLQLAMTLEAYSKKRTNQGIDQNMIWWKLYRKSELKKENHNKKAQVK